MKCGEVSLGSVVLACCAKHRLKTAVLVAVFSPTTAVLPQVTVQSSGQSCSDSQSERAVDDAVAIIHDACKFLGVAAAKDQVLPHLAVVHSSWC